MGSYIKRMKNSSRAWSWYAFLLAGVVVLAALAIAVLVMPGPRFCPSVTCGSKFDSGVRVLDWRGTHAQAYVLLAGLLLAACLVVIGMSHFIRGRRDSPGETVAASPSPPRR